MGEFCFVFCSINHVYCSFFFQPILKAGDEVDEPSEREQLRTVLKRMGKLRCMREVRAWGSRSFSWSLRSVSFCCSFPFVPLFPCHLMASGGTYFSRSLAVIVSSLVFLLSTNIFLLILV